MMLDKLLVICGDFVWIDLDWESWSFVKFLEGV